MTNTIINRLEALSEAWKAQFDNPPTIPLLWSIDAQTGVLSLDSVGVCPAADIEPAGETYDVEVMSLPIQNGYVDIVIDWPYGGEAKISEVVTHKVVADAVR